MLLSYSILHNLFGHKKMVCMSQIISHLWTGAVNGNILIRYAWDANMSHTTVFKIGSVRKIGHISCLFGYTRYYLTFSNSWNGFCSCVPQIKKNRNVYNLIVNEAVYFGWHYCSRGAAFVQVFLYMPTSVLSKCECMCVLFASSTFDITKYVHALMLYLHTSHTYRKIWIFGIWTVHRKSKCFLFMTFTSHESVL